LETHDEEIPERMDADLLGTPAHAILLETTTPSLMLASISPGVLKG